MALIPKFPVGLGAREVKTFNEETKSIWFQERALLNNPLCDFHQYTYSLVAAVLPDVYPTVQRSLVTETLAVPCSVPDLDLEVVANSGGLVQPTDRFLSVYDINPNILSVIEWPSRSGNLFSMKRKEYNAASGRCEMLIRNSCLLKGVVYRRITGQAFSGSTWNVVNTTQDTVLTVQRAEMDAEAAMLFAGIAITEDVVFWALASNFTYNGTKFIPAMHDFIIDRDTKGTAEVFQVIKTQFDAGESFYRILARRYTETS